MGIIDKFKIKQQYQQIKREEKKALQNFANKAKEIILNISPENWIINEDFTAFTTKRENINITVTKYQPSSEICNKYSSPYPNPPYYVVNINGERLDSADSYKIYKKLKKRLTSRINEIKKNRQNDKKIANIQDIQKKQNLLIETKNKYNDIINKIK